MKSTITPEMSPETFKTIETFANGYLAGLSTDELYEGWDEWHSLTISKTESWDINFHMCGEPNRVYVVAHPEHMGKDGFMETEMSQWVEIKNVYKRITTKKAGI